MKSMLILAAAALLLVAFAVSQSSASTTLTLKSDAFKDGATIPQVYSCDGKSISPQLSWSGAPVKTQSFALTVFDPDARGGAGFWHWVLYDVPADVTSLAVGVQHAGTEGANGRGDDKFTGPCPPPGDTPHHYVFTLYALDFTPKGDFDGPQLDDAIKDHVLAKAVLVGRFGR
ncbi:MAG TPA: YbhB/YbcL family Raf kinase inhibitor-like protein [Candidatus Eremiobacteraceae bacterium]|nr:YbhB/YbcL family Raf kinase inhibitor-like protein [Candidatus Eremiobacteraceae bacterium]